MVTVIDNIHMTPLDNGLVVVVEQMPWLSSLSMNLNLPLGSVTDPDGCEGSSVIMHDWLYRGAGIYSSRQLIDALNDLGLRQGGAAGKEHITLRASMLSGVLPKALALYADIVQRPKFLAEEFEPARLLAIQDLESLDDDPMRRLFIHLTQQYFASRHKRSTYGTLESLEALTADKVREDYAQRCTPDGAILSIAGGITFDEAMAAIEPAFSTWSGPKAQREAVKIAPVNQGHIEADTSQMQIGVAYEAIPPQSPHWYEHQMAMRVLSGGMGARLFKEVRDKRGLVYSVFAGTYAVKHYGYTLAYAGTTTERAVETQEVLLAELKRLRKGVTLEEFTRARTGLLSDVVMQGESSSARSNALSGSTYQHGKPKALNELKTLIEQVTLERVNDFLASTPEPAFTVWTLGAGTPVAEVVPSTSLA